MDSISLAHRESAAGEAHAPIWFNANTPGVGPAYAFLERAMGIEPASEAWEACCEATRVIFIRLLTDELH